MSSLLLTVAAEAEHVPVVAPTEADVPPGTREVHKLTRTIIASTLSH